MKQETLTMTYSEIDRVNLIQQCIDKKLKQNHVAKLLGISYRQLKRLVKRFRREGAKGIVSKARGRNSNRRYCETLKRRALEHIKQDFYDYGPTLAAEKLDEYHGIKASKETVRKWMVEENIWHPHQKKVPKIHPSRERRACIGELVQIDGSIHDWFENRGPRCTLLVFIDDATSIVQKLYFCDQETTINYMTILKNYILKYGIPRTFYFDKHAVFKVNHPDALKNVTQFLRVLETLGIEPIYAHSAQAKGRVERVNETLQDRLVKALRYFKINDIDSANTYADEYLKGHNLKFGTLPKLDSDLHRAITEDEKHNLDKIFSIQTKRVISKGMLVNHNRTIYKINEPEQIHRLCRAPVLICENIEGQVSIYHEDKPLNYEVYRKGTHSDQCLNRASVNSYLDKQLKLEKIWVPAGRLPHHQGASH